MWEMPKYLHIPNILITVFKYHPVPNNMRWDTEAETYQINVKWPRKPINELNSIWAVLDSISAVLRPGRSANLAWWFLCHLWPCAVELVDGPGASVCVCTLSLLLGHCSV